MDNENGTAVVVAAAAAVATTKGIALIFQQIFFFSFSFMRDFIFLSLSHVGHIIRPHRIQQQWKPSRNTTLLGCVCVHKVTNYEPELFLPTF